MRVSEPPSKKAERVARRFLAEVDSFDPDTIEALETHSWVRLRTMEGEADVSANFLLRLYREMQLEQPPQVVDCEPPIEGALESGPTPPIWAERLLSFLCSRNTREAVLGDLSEGFQERAAESNLQAARRWYRMQVFWSGGSFIWCWARRLVEIRDIWDLIGF